MTIDVFYVLITGYVQEVPPWGWSTGLTHVGDICVLMCERIINCMCICWSFSTLKSLTLFVCLSYLLVLPLLCKRATFYSGAKLAAVQKTMHTVSFGSATAFGSNNTCLLQTAPLIQKRSASYYSYVFKMFSHSLRTIQVLWPVSGKLQIMRVICIH
jgi:hypothetical protein